MALRRSGDMTQGSPLGHIVCFSAPLLVGNLFQQLYNMVDSVVVGRFVGPTALAAVGIGFPVTFLLSSIFLGFSMGATVMVAQYIGGDDPSSVGRTIDTLYGALLLSAVPLTLLGAVISRPMLALIHCPQDAYAEALIYTMVIFAGMIGSLGYNINTGILQGLGDSKSPLVFLVIACITNIVLDLLFVLVFHLGVLGVALATILAQCVSWIIGIFYIDRRYPFINIRLFRIRMDPFLLRRLIRIGIPSAIQQCQFAVVALLMQMVINDFGTDFAAGFSAANKIDTFVFMPIGSFSTAATTYVGQNMGAGRLDRVRQGVHGTILLSVAASVFMSAFVIAFRTPLMSLFSSRPEVIASGNAYLLRVLTPMPVFALLFVLNSVLRGAGCTVVPMVSSVVSMWAARLPAAYLLAHWFGQNELYWSYPFGWILGLTITLPVYFRRKWLQMPDRPLKAAGLGSNEKEASSNEDLYQRGH